MSQFCGMSLEEVGGLVLSPKPIEPGSKDAIHTMEEPYRQPECSLSCLQHFVQCSLERQTLKVKMIECFICCNIPEEETAVSITVLTQWREVQVSPACSSTQLVVVPADGLTTALLQAVIAVYLAVHSRVCFHLVPF